MSQFNESGYRPEDEDQDFVVKEPEKRKTSAFGRVVKNAARDAVIAAGLMAAASHTVEAADHKKHEFSVKEEAKNIEAWLKAVGFEGVKVEHNSMKGKGRELQSKEHYVILFSDKKHSVLMEFPAAGNLDPNYFYRQLARIIANGQQFSDLSPVEKQEILDEIEKQIGKKVASPGATKLEKEKTAGTKKLVEHANDVLKDLHLDKQFEVVAASARIDAKRLSPNQEHLLLTIKGQAGGGVLISSYGHEFTKTELPKKIHTSIEQLEGLK